MTALAMWHCMGLVEPQMSSHNTAALLPNGVSLGEANCPKAT